MKVTKGEVVRSKRPIPLPEPWRPAWMEPDLTPVTSFDFAFYRLHTDAGIVGIGPFTGAAPELAVGEDPCHVEAFWYAHMSGKRFRTSGKAAAGLEIALWDIIGKAAGLPIHRMLGTYRERILVYAATARLLNAEQQAAQAVELHRQGFKAIKLRMHRATADEDLEVMAAVRQAVGDKVSLLVDANQNAASKGYAHWDRMTAQRVARRLEALGFDFLEEPLPHTDPEGLAAIAASVDMHIAGGEGISTVYEFGRILQTGAYDIVQPDPTLTGNFGISGLRKMALMAEDRGRVIMPHVTNGALFGINFAAAMQAMATVPNCPMVEYVYDPPVLTAETQQVLLKEPILVEFDGCVTVPKKPGLGIELDEEWIADHI